jgi:hypothetical protein
MAQDEKVSEFYTENEFDRIGVLPQYYTIDGKKVDASVWVRAFHRAQTVIYKPQVQGQPVDLSVRPLTKPWRLPGWLWTLFLQFGLPICCVALLFAVSYLLVLFGPLRGISNKYIKEDSPIYEDDEEYEVGAGGDEDL